MVSKAAIINVYRQFCSHYRVPVAPSTTPIKLTNVNCNYDLDNTEGHILRCDFSQVIPPDCSHKTDVAVECCK